MLRRVFQLSFKLCQDIYTIINERLYKFYWATKNKIDNSTEDILESHLDYDEKWILFIKLWYPTIIFVSSNTCRFFGYHLECGFLEKGHHGHTEIVGSLLRPKEDSQKHPYTHRIYPQSIWFYLKMINLN